MSEREPGGNAGGPARILDSARRIALTALDRWDLAVREVEPIKIRENAVFRLDCTGGKRAVLRVHREGYHSDAELRSEFAWMRTLAESGVPVPQVIPSCHGNEFEVIAATSAPGSHQVDVLEWIDGHPLGSVESSLVGDVSTIAERYRMIGRTMALMHNQSEHWRLPAEFVRHAWNAPALVGERPFWGRFWDLGALTPGERDLLRRTRARLQRDLAVYPTSPQRYGLIHADLVPENILVTPSGLRVIDFDDAGFGWHWFDIATSLYFITAENYYPQALQALLTGYEERRPVPGDVDDHLPVFMAARATTYLGWVHTRSGTETANALTPYLIERACDVCSVYLAHRGH